MDTATVKGGEAADATMTELQICKSSVLVQCLVGFSTVFAVIVSVAILYGVDAALNTQYVSAFTSRIQNEKLLCLLICVQNMWRRTRYIDARNGQRLDRSQVAEIRRRAALNRTHPVFDNTTSYNTTTTSHLVTNPIFHSSLREQTI